MDFSRNVGGIVDELDLEKAYDKSIIKFRFLDEISFYEQKRDHTKKYYNAFRFIVTTGSILLPAILSMGQMDPTKLPANFDMISYWASWTISLMVTASNGFLQLFSLDKNYFSYSMVVEQLKTEGWQFFGLSGKYEDYETHQQAYKVFSKSIESIKRKQVEQEFSNGKGDSKKKKFDFHGEMKKFSQEQQLQSQPKIQSEKIEDVKKKVVESVPPEQTNVKEEIVDVTEKKEEKKEETKEEIKEEKKEEN
tara:strand:- start:8 stop:757 length:750 start_codon:yes stop_codon:yes gene_type:complete